MNEHSVFLPATVQAPEKLTRSSVQKLELLEYTSSTLVFRATSLLDVYHFACSADPEMNELESKGDKTITGTLRLDIFSDDTVRVRYAEDGTPAAPDWGFIVDMPAPATAPADCKVLSGAGIDGVDLIRWENSTLAIEADVTDGRITFFRKGKSVVSIGGKERNFFYRWDGMGTGVCRVHGTDDRLAVEKFSLTPGEAVYGFGESFGEINKAGQTVDLDITDAMGVTTPRSYKSAPFYMTTRGYGAFFNTGCRMRFCVGSQSRCDIQVAIDENQLDYFVFFGSLKEILAAYTNMVGRCVMPPDWSFGFWQSKLTYHSADEIIKVVDSMRKEDFPCDVIHLDTHWFKYDWLCDLEFDRERFPYDNAWRKHLADEGVHISCWQLPYLPCGTRLFDRLASAGGFAKDKDGNLYNCKFCLAPDFKGDVVGIIDYSNPVAVEIMRDEFARLFREHGVNAIKTDFGEWIPDDAHFYNGMTGRQMHNYYPFLYAKTIYEITRETTGKGVIWGRSAWVGSQRFPLFWGGDNSANFENIVPQLGGGLSIGLSGFPFWSQDIGGFLGHIQPHLLVRWMQVGTLLSHARIHGYGDRELPGVPEPAKSQCRDAVHLRYRLMPTLLGIAEECVASAMPMTRALVLEFQDDLAVQNITDQFLIGDKFMVAPIFTAEDERMVYFPEGRWVDFFTGEEFIGPCRRELACPREHTLLYQREGSIVPMIEAQEYVHARDVDECTVRVCKLSAPGKRSFSFKLNSTPVTATYVFDGASHRIDFSEKPVDMDVEWM